MPFAYGLLIGSAALAAYIVLGYPVILIRRKWSTAPRVRKELGFQPTVSVIMAVHNGAAHLGAKLEVLAAFDYPQDRIQIIVVSDGSTDDTEAIAERFEKAPITLLKVPRGGKAAALNQALAVASGEILFLTDVRQPLDPLALSHLAANFADPTVGAATGELKLMPGEDGEHKDMDLYWRYEVMARKRHSDIDSLFTTTGCIYAVRRSLAEPIPPDTLTDDATMALRAFFRGYRVIFDPAAIAYDYPAVAGTEFRRRFRTLAGLWQLHARMPQIFTRRNRMRFHFLSHKFSRLVLPWALLLFAGASIALPASRFRTSLLVIELAFVLLAAANRFVPKGFPLKRISSPAQTFLVMNAAALAAVAVFFVPATRLWKPTRVESR
jgi:cellulose synthase/poly-beta-1,6-N-acetylglucosamine synthase-like glycosyltransferase